MNNKKKEDVKGKKQYKGKKKTVRYGYIKKLGNVI